jgi:hypothetical protein
MFHGGKNIEPELRRESILIGRHKPQKQSESHIMLIN